MDSPEPLRQSQIKEWTTATKPLSVANSQVKPRLSGVRFEDVRQLLSDDHWSLQQKFDGHRVIVDLRLGQVFNRQGLRYEHEDKVLSLDLPDLPIIFDAEFMSQSGTLQVFDVLGLLETMDTISTTPYQSRYEFLSKFFEKVGNSDAKLVPTFLTTEEKTDAFHAIRKAGGEGVVFRYIYANNYSYGVNVVKHKFIKDVDCKVLATGLDGKSNLELGMYDGNKYVSVGKCSALTGDGPRVKVGDVVTVQVLYSTKDGRLFHPTLPAIRTDKLPEECGTDQLEEVKTNKDYIYV